MSDDIPFDRKFPVPSGRLDEVTPLVRRIVAPNPSPFTFTGTCSYIIGRGQVAILDPGPDDPAHVAALLDAVRGETVTHIVVTHTHRDHSPAAAALKAATGAVTVGEGPHRPARPLHIGEINALDASGDMDFLPDIALAEGEALTGPGWTLEAIATPGHTANHLAFALPENDLLFSGDHVMAWATTIVAPPDGAMGDYVRSLKKLAARSEPLYLPGHGGPVRDAPAFVRDYLDHRRAREAAILRGLERNTTIPDLVRGIYIGLDPRLVGAASLTVLAHLEDMVGKGLVTTEGPPAIDGAFVLVR
ncbi:metallo-beta-lactamase superfamily protein [Azorhizobium caulinodans ORS 571]|uniref:Metallo-beta-lactamase superfamily protein n=1 Tax=Azorhizobium caulinodans (strain ATCC 43989 / DSM 5975 / JCM 20966 / LMG 6465 / NBRC 14845 / NCIMB 13405 / ORS 571) TaxID=438753 RepID=A8HXB6_AZOC5|nr:MBL fold metallo-hydrolase [Azorhizobium caulinodans]BAF87480.1 metallo-beta-lactamase superfamily protein [Azorhizobium caulinodans ORS 571]